MKVSTFTVKNGRSGGDVVYTWTLSSIVDGEETVLKEVTGAQMEHTFGPETNRWYAVALSERKAGSHTRSYATKKVVSKYVRRELRALNEEDRTKIFEAMEVIYKLDDDEGQRRFGSKYKSAAYLAAVHSSVNHFCYHWGDMFITSHPAFQLWFEDSLRAVDPSISTSFYWDFMLDDALYAERWYNESELYRDDWFGPFGRAEDNWRVERGRFKVKHLLLPTPLTSPSHHPTTTTTPRLRSRP